MKAQVSKRQNPESRSHSHQRVLLIRFNWGFLRVHFLKTSSVKSKQNQNNFFFFFFEKYSLAQPSACKNRSFRQLKGPVHGHPDHMGHLVNPSGRKGAHGTNREEQSRKGWKPRMCTEQQKARLEAEKWAVPDSLLNLLPSSAHALWAPPSLSQPT